MSLREHIIIYESECECVLCVVCCVWCVCACGFGARPSGVLLCPNERRPAAAAAAAGRRSVLHVLCVCNYVLHEYVSICCARDGGVAARYDATAHTIIQHTHTVRHAHDY